MRNLDRDRQRVYIARYLRTAPVEDGDGLLTGRNAPVYSNPEEFWPTVKPLVGEAVNDIFGQELDYDVTITVDDPSFNAAESDRIWLRQYTPERREESWDGNVDSEDGNEVSIDGGAFGNVSNTQHDYVVMKVARTFAYTVIAAKRVEVAA